MSPANGPNARSAPRSPRPPDVPPAQAHGSQDAEPEPRPGSESAAGSRQGTTHPAPRVASLHPIQAVPRRAAPTPQPPSASSPRSGPDGPAQGARCSPPPASIARDSGTAPKSRAEAGGPNLPQPIQKRAGAPTADPNLPQRLRYRPVNLQPDTRRRAVPTASAARVLQRREPDQTFSRKLAKQRTRGNILHTATAVPPPPALAQRNRKPRAAPLRVRRQQRTDLRQLRRADTTALYYPVHAGQRNTTVSVTAHPVVRVAIRCPG